MRKIWQKISQTVFTIFELKAPVQGRSDLTLFQTMTRKRNLDSNAATGVQHPKRVKLSTAQGLSDNSPQCSITSADQDSTPTDVREKGKGKAIESERPETQGGPSRPRMNKLQPPRPFPTVPTSVSATGPRSAHTEGKNYICITRKTSLGAYMRRCKDVIIQDGCAVLGLLSSIPPLLTSDTHKKGTRLYT